MRYWNTLLRLAILLSLAEFHAAANAQGTGDSPYSAYGFGDLFGTGSAAQALMGSTGVAYTEPFDVISSNPATYPSLVRPSFNTGVKGSFTNLSTSDQSTRRNDAGFGGFSVGVPFGKKPWGMALGLTPYSEVNYTITDRRTLDTGPLRYEYSGTGGISRAFFGLGRALVLHKPDTLGNAGSRLSIGANFDFLFGSLEQTRKAIYPAGQGYNNTTAFSSVVLRAPTADFGLLFSSQLISRDQVKKMQDRRKAKQKAALEAWKVTHPDSKELPRQHEFRDPEGWRYHIGVTGDIPTVFNATHTDLETSWVYTFSGAEFTRDTIQHAEDVHGTITVPYSIGAGISAQNSRWMFTAEARRRDWGAMMIDVPGYGLPAPLRASMVFSAGARLRPRYDGTLLQRTIYRAGVRMSDEYLQVHGIGLSSLSGSLGLSLPLNAIQTNSYIHLGVEVGQRGTTDSGLIKESFVNLWVGISITPWHGERWFHPFQIQ